MIDEVSKRLVTEKDDSYRAFHETDEVRCIKRDRELFDYFFTELEKEDWILYYDEPTRKLSYKYEKDCTLVSSKSECIVKAPLTDVLCLFAELDFFKEWMPNITSVTIEKQVTDYRGIYNFKQYMPWPMWPREIKCMATGMYDRKNKACVSVCSPVLPGESWFGHTIPEIAEGHVNVDMRRGYHYF